MTDIYKNGLGIFLVDQVARGSMPFGSSDTKWTWLRDEILKLSIDGLVLRVQCPNKLTARRAQSVASSYNRKNRTGEFVIAQGAVVFTRSHAVNSTSEEYYLYVGLTKQK